MTPPVTRAAARLAPVEPRLPPPAIDDPAPDDAVPDDDGGEDVGVVLARAQERAAAILRSRSAILGAVTDERTGEPLSGVTVVVTSPQLVGTQAEITDEQGGYAIVGLPTGSYEVTFYYFDLTVVRSNVMVTSLDTTPVFQQLDPASIDEARRPRASRSTTPTPSTSRSRAGPSRLRSARPPAPSPTRSGSRSRGPPRWRTPTSSMASTSRTCGSARSRLAAWPIQSSRSPPTTGRSSSSSIRQRRRSRSTTSSRTSTPSTTTGPCSTA